MDKTWEEGSLRKISSTRFQTFLMLRREGRDRASCTLEHVYATTRTRRDLTRNRPKRGGKSSLSSIVAPGHAVPLTLYGGSEASLYSSRIMMERVCSGGCCASRDPPPPPPPPPSLPPSLVHTLSLLSPPGRCLLRSFVLA